MVDKSEKSFFISIPGKDIIRNDQAKNKQHKDIYKEEKKPVSGHQGDKKIVCRKEKQDCIKEYNIYSHEIKIHNTEKYHQKGGQGSSKDPHKNDLLHLGKCKKSRQGWESRIPVILFI